MTVYRAPAGAVKEALAELVVEECWPTVELHVELAYDRPGALKRLVHPPEIVMADEEYGRRVRVKLVVRTDRRAEIEDSIAALGASLRDVRADPR